MRKVVLLPVLSVVVMLCLSSAWAQDLGVNDAAKPGIVSSPPGAIGLVKAVPQQDRLFSPSVARRLHDMAYELGKDEGKGAPEIEQAIVLLKAAMELDSGAGYALPTMIELACRDSRIDHSALVRGLLRRYIGETADLEVARKAVMYLLERVNSREERETILGELLVTIGGKNAIFSSDLLTMLGLLMAQKPDLEAARFYLAQAYKANRHNKVAFEKFAQLFPDKIRPENYLGHFRLALSEDPTNIEAALGIGEHSEQVGLYDTAGAAYQYAADLFKYLYPAEALPARIYIPWAISCYNTDENQPKCLEIANLVRQSGRFNLLLEALAGKAAAKLGDDERATKIFQAAEKQAQLLLSRGPGLDKGGSQADARGLQEVTAKQFAWFYCFALPNPQKALDWGNKAFASEPNSPSSAGILAYALTMNGQSEWAKPLIEKNEPSQILELVLAQIQIAEGEKDQAKEALKSAIARDPGSLAAEQARAILDEQGGEYIPPADPDVVFNMLKQVFGESLVPVFSLPEQMMSVQFNIRGNKFPYGSEFGAVIAVINNSSDTFVVSDDGLFRGNIRIDADVSGDLTMKIPELVSMKVRSDYLIDSGQSILIPVKLVTGKLKRLLQTFPQASVDIEFTLFIDPLVTAAGEVMNRLAMIEPTTLLVRRSGIELSSKYLRNRFNLISKGQEGQKIKTAQLFIGLLMEQYAMSNRKPPYKFVYADWMPTMFRNALVHESGLLRRADGEWVVKVHTMAEMVFLPLDHELVAAVAENLDNGSWPVRMMSIYLLAKTQEGKFDKVLEWAATYDPDTRVREMAIALGAGGPGIPATLEALPATEEQAKPLPTEEK